MKKCFWMGFFTSILLLMTGMVLLYSQKDDISLETTLKYEKELSAVKGYERLSYEERQRIEELTGKFQIGKMRLHSSGFNSERYEDESYVDVLVGQEIDFRNVDDIIFWGEHYQIMKIDTHDAEYYFSERYTGSLYNFGEKSAVEIWFHSLDDGMNVFGIIIAANGNVFFQPGSVVRYGERIYTVWGIYEVLPQLDKEDCYGQ